LKGEDRRVWLFLLKKFLNAQKLTPSVIANKVKQSHSFLDKRRLPRSPDYIGVARNDIKRVGLVFSLKFLMSSDPDPSVLKEGQRASNPDLEAREPICP